MTTPSNAVVDDLVDYVSRLQWSDTFSDIVIHCQDGQIKSHCVVLCRMSPFLQRLLSGIDEPQLHLPDVPLDDMKILLSLLYTGVANVYKGYISAFKWFCTFIQFFFSYP